MKQKRENCVENSIERLYQQAKGHIVCLPDR